MNASPNSPSAIAASVAFTAKAPVVNSAVLRDAANGNPDEMRALAEIYLAQADESMAKLAVTVQAGTARDVCRLAHRLAGGSASFGMIGIIAPLRALEQLGKQGQLEGAQTLLAQASQQLEAIRHWLHEHAMHSNNHHLTTHP
ncbi:MAG: Hpt domain-containing protein [Verrucomicrobiota bacterium]